MRNSNSYNTLWTMGHLPPIYFKPDHLVGNEPRKNLYSLKVEIKTQPWESSRELVLLNVIIFKTGSSKAVKKFLVLVNITIKGQNLKTPPQCCATTKNLLIGKAQQKLWNCQKTITNYKLVMQVLITHLFYPKVLQLKKRYIWKDLLKTQEYKILKFFYRVNNIID